jgi:acyl carrier protein
MRDAIIKVISSTLKDLNEDLQKEELNNPGAQTYIYGRRGNLDSLALVSLIADLEGKISCEFGNDIILADERAMSQANSPFKTVGNLAEYIHNLLRAEK